MVGVERGRCPARVYSWQIADIPTRGARMRVPRLISGFTILLAGAVAAATGLAGGPVSPAAAATGAAVARARPAATTSVMSWGDNSAGELGNGTLTPSTTPVAVGGSGGIHAISS